MTNNLHSPWNTAVVCIFGGLMAVVILGVTESIFLGYGVAVLIGMFHRS